MAVTAFDLEPMVQVGTKEAHQAYRIGAGMHNSNLTSFPGYQIRLKDNTRPLTNPAEAPQLN
jgi:hypothetical protein